MSEEMSEEIASDFEVIAPPAGRNIKDFCLFKEILVIVCDDYSAWYLRENRWHRIRPIGSGLEPVGQIRYERLEPICPKQVN